MKITYYISPSTFQKRILSATLDPRMQENSRPNVRECIQTSVFLKILNTQLCILLAQNILEVLVIQFKTIIFSSSLF
jgi:hypothetical protein